MLPLLLTAVLGVAASAPMTRCDRGAPEPIGFHSRGFGYVAELFPPKSRRNPGTKPRAYLYTVAYPGREWRVEAHRLWTAELANALMPDAALVSAAGHVVTLDDYDGAGGNHALVVYATTGRLVRSFALEQLLGAETSRVARADCGLLWREGTSFYFASQVDPKLYIVLPWNRVLEVTLSTGTLRRGILGDFPALREILKTQYPNELTEVWATSLRFSSLTDLDPPK